MTSRRQDCAVLLWREPDQLMWCIAWALTAGLGDKRVDCPEDKRGFHISFVQSLEAWTTWPHMAEWAIIRVPRPRKLGFMVRAPHVEVPWGDEIHAIRSRMEKHDFERVIVVADEPSPFKPARMARKVSEAGTSEEDRAIRWVVHSNDRLAGIVTTISDILRCLDHNAGGNRDGRNWIESTTECALWWFQKTAQVLGASDADDLEPEYPGEIGRREACAKCRPVWLGDGDRNREERRPLYLLVRSRYGDMLGPYQELLTTEGLAGAKASVEVIDWDDEQEAPLADERPGEAAVRCVVHGHASDGRRVEMGREDLGRFRPHLVWTAKEKPIRSLTGVNAKDPRERPPVELETPLPWPPADSAWGGGTAESQKDTPFEWSRAGMRFYQAVHFLLFADEIRKCGRLNGNG